MISALTRTGMATASDMAMSRITALVRVPPAGKSGCESAGRGGWQAITRAASGGPPKKPAKWGRF